MITVHQTKPSSSAIWLLMILVFLIFTSYGLPAIEWILMKLYELFIQNNPMPIV